MSLVNPSALASISWQLTKANPPFQPTKQGQDSRQFSLAVPAGATTVYVGQLSLTASASQDVAFNSFTDLAGNAVTITKIYGIIVIPDIAGTDAAGVCSIKPSASNGLTGWIFNSTAMPIPSGGCLFQAQATPVTVSGTVNSLNFENTGTGTLTVDIVVLCGA
jgi:hypothetical protein